MERKAPLFYKCYISKLIFAIVLFMSAFATHAQLSKPDRVVLFFIDGLHWKAPEKLHMPVLNRLVSQGTFISKSYMIAPHHPTTGEYGRLHTSSFPNPVLHAGTLFIRPDNRMVQDVFSPAGSTAFITNTNAYSSVARGFQTAILDPSLSDDEVVYTAMDLLSKRDYKFMRIHLQTAGNEGRYLSYTTPDKAYYRNIWGQESPYIKTVEHADSLLGVFISFLKDRGMFDNSLLIVSSDQGQSDIGWHPIVDEDSWVTPLLFLGPGIARGRQLPYFEHTDLVPTICGLMGLEKPSLDGGAGHFISEVLSGEDATLFSHPQYIKTINRQLNEYNALRSRIILGAEKDKYLSSYMTFLENQLLTPEPFYHMDRITEWYHAGNTEHLIEVNGKLLLQMKQELKKYSK